MSKMELSEYMPFVIRKFSRKEKFNPDLIYESLLRETNISEENAREITNNTLRFLINTKIKYVTSPMLREIVNIMLLQSGLENERLRYTRIGFPMYDLDLLLKNRNYYENIDKKIVKHIKNEYKEVLNLIEKIKENGKDE